MSPPPPRILGILRWRHPTLRLSLTARCYGSSRLAPTAGLPTLEVVLPQIDVNGVARRGRSAPELTRREVDGVHMLRLSAQRLAIRVGALQCKDPVVANDRAPLAAGVTRLPRVPFGMDVSRPHALSRLEPRSDPEVLARRATRVVRWSIRRGRRGGLRQK